MKISRIGAAADHGTRSVNLPDPKYTWTAIDNSLKIRHGKARDFSTTANHSYVIAITETEIIQILSTLAAAGMNVDADRKLTHLQR